MKTEFYSAVCFIVKLYKTLATIICFAAFHSLLLVVEVVPDFSSFFSSLDGESSAFSFVFSAAASALLHNNKPLNRADIPIIIPTTITKSGLR
jgi:hypothetical protein